jgi:hypothetical protein
MEMTKFNLSLASTPIADTYLYGDKIFLYRFFTSDLDTFIKLQSTIDCYERIKKFLPLIAGLGNADSKNLKEKREQLSADFLNKISNSDLDKIADVYLSTQVMQGTFKQFSENNNILKKNDDEPTSKYLDRLLNKYIKDYLDNNNPSKNIALSMLNEPSLNKIFDATRKSSDLLGSTLERYEKLNFIKASPSNMSDNLIRAQDELFNAQNKQYQKIANDRKDELKMVGLTADMTVQSAKLLKELSDAATKFLDQSEVRNTKANKTTKLQMWIAVGSLFFSLVLAGIALYFTYQSYQQDKQNNAFNNATNEKWQNDLIKLLKKDLDKNALSDQELIATKIEVNNLKKDLAKLQSKKK